MEENGETSTSSSKHKMAYPPKPEDAFVWCTGTGMSSPVRWRRLSHFGNGEVSRREQIGLLLALDGVIVASIVGADLAASPSFGEQ